MNNEEIKKILIMNKVYENSSQQFRLDAYLNDTTYKEIIDDIYKIIVRDNIDSMDIAYCQVIHEKAEKLKNKIKNRNK